MSISDLKTRLLQTNLHPSRVAIPILNQVKHGCCRDTYNLLTKGDREASISQGKRKLTNIGKCKVL